MKECENCKLLKETIANYERMFDKIKQQKPTGLICKTCGEKPKPYIFLGGKGYFYGCKCTGEGSGNGVSICPTLAEAEQNFIEKNK
jgi:hypothetical protein